MSNFEQRLLSEIEFRLERTPVEESDDEVQHDESPTGKCVAPIFDRKLRNFRAMEGVPMTFSCKVVGIPVPKVRQHIYVFFKYVMSPRMFFFFCRGFHPNCLIV